MKSSGNPSFIRLCLATLLFVSYTDTYVFAAPRGAHVVSGTATFQQEGNLTVITAGNRSIINYQSFNIGPNQTVQFVQPNANASVLNRVLSPNPTNIFGQLQANGNVFIVNPYGIFFQNGAVLNVGSLYAAAGRMSNADFTSGHIHFTDLQGDVRNDGVLAADNRIALMGANVVNNGSMTSAQGMAMMVSGQDVYVGPRNGNIFVQANGWKATSTSAAAAGSIINRGTVSAPRVLLGAGDLYSTAIVNSGLLQGRNIAVNAGANGSATVGGRLDASSASNHTATGKGGSIQVLGGQVALQGAALDASGGSGGGAVRVGGDFHGGGTLAHATTTSVDAATTIKADATGATGNGGSVVLWSDKETYFGGSISARGGSAGGNGGSAEVSSGDNLAYRGMTDLRATAGTVGSLLLDPSNIYISDTTQPGTTVTPVTTVNPTVTFGMGTSGAEPITIQVTGLTGLNTALTTASVVLQANNDIFVNQSINPATGTGNLTLNAGRSVFVGDNVAAASGGHPNIAVTLGGMFTATINDAGATTADRASGAAVFSMGAGSSITAPGGVTITAGAFIGNGASLNANTGDITLQGITTTATNPVLMANSIPTSGTITVNDNVAGAVGKNITVNGTLLTSGPAANMANPSTSAGDVILAAGGAVSVNAVTASGVGAAGVGGAISLRGDISLSLNGAISGRSLATGTGAATFNDGSTVTTSGGGQTYNGPVLLNQTATGLLTTLSDTGNGNITFASTATVDSNLMNPGQSLAVNTGGNEEFDGIVGGNAALAALSTDTTGTPAGTTTFGMDASGLTAGKAGVMAGVVTINDMVNFSAMIAPGTTSSVLTTGGQTYHQAATLVKDTALTDTGTGTAVDFVSTVEGTHNLTLTAAGNEIFEDRVGGGGNPLLSLTTNGGTTRLELSGGTTVPTVTTVNNVAPSDTATGAQTYNSNVVLYGDTMLSSIFAAPATTGGAIAFKGTVAGPSTAANLTLVAGAGSTLFAAGATVAAAALDLSGAQVSFNQSVGVTNALNTLTVSRNGTLTGITPGIGINNGGFTTSAGQIFRDAVTLGATTTPGTTTLADTSGNDITFSKGIDGNMTGTQALVVNTTGSEVFNGAIGAKNPLSGLTTDNDTSIPVGGQAQFKAAAVVNGDVAVNDAALFQVAGTAATPTVKTTGSQTYAHYDNVLGADTYLLSTGGGAISVGSTTGPATGDNNAVDGAYALTLDTSGATALHGLVGNTTGGAPTGLTITGGTGTTLDSAIVKTTGLQDYAAPVTLARDVTLTSLATTAAAGPITFGSTVDGAFTLSIGTVGATTFNGAVGGTTELTSLVTTGSGIVKLNGSTVTTNVGGQSYTGPVEIDKDATLTDIGGGDIAFNNTVNSPLAGPPQTLEVDTAGKETFVGLVGGSSALASLTTDANTLYQGGQVNFNAVGNVASPTVKTTGGQTYNDQVRLGNATVLQGSMLTLGTGVTVDGAGSTGTGSDSTPTQNYNDLTLALISPVSLTGAITTNAAPVPTTTPGQFNNIRDFVSNGPVNLVGAFQTAGSQTYNATASVTSTADLTSGVQGSALTHGDINFQSTVLGPADLTLNPAGIVIFHDTVGSLASLLVNGNTSITGGGLVTSSGAQTYGGNLSLSVSTALVGGSVVAGSETGNSNDLTVNAGFSSFGQITTGGNLTFNIDTGESDFTGTVDATSLTRNGTGLTSLSGGRVTTDSALLGQSYGGGVQLGAASTLLEDTAPGPITFHGTVDGDGVATRTLTVNTGNATTFDGAVGGIQPLGSLTTNSSGLLTGTTVFNTGGVAVTTIEDANGGGAQTYNNAVRLQQDTTLQSIAGTGGTGGDITFSRTVDSDSTTQRTLVASTAGNEIFNGIVGGVNPLLGLVTDQAGGGSTIGGQTQFNIKLPKTTMLPSPTDLPAGEGGVNVGTGGVTVNDQAVFNVTNSSSAKVPDTLSPTDHASIATTGPQKYNDTLAPVLLKADTVLKGTTLTLADGVDGTLATGTAYSLTLDFSSSPVVLPGGIVNLNNFASVGDGGTQLAGAFTTLGFQYYKTAVTLNSDSLLISSGGQNITFDGRVNGAATLSLTTQGDEVFNNLVGNLVSLTGLVVDNGVMNATGTTRFYMTLPGDPPVGMAGVRVGTGGVMVNDAVVFGINGSTLAPSPLYSVLSVGPQTYAQAAALQATTVLTSTGGGDITFGNTVDGRADLTLDSAGNEIFNGRVGGQQGLELLSLTTDAETTYRGGSVIFNVASSATTPTVTTVNLTPPNFPLDEATGAQTYHDSVQLEKDTFLSSGFNGAFGATTGGAITFYGPVTNFGATAESLTVSAGVGQTVFGTGAPVNAARLDIGGAQVTFLGPVGTAASPLNILTVGSNGTLAGTVPSIDINNGFITSTLGQTYTSQVFLSEDAVLTDTNLHNISFIGPVDSFDAQPRALTLSTGGAVTFNGLVGSVNPLAALTSSAPQGTFFNLDLTGQLTGVAGVHVTGDNVASDNGVTINGPVTFNVMGSSLTDLNHPTVESGNGQLYNGAVTLARNTSLYSSGGGSLAFTGTVDDVAGATPVGVYGLALNSTGNEIFGGIVGGQTSLTSLTVDTQLAPDQGQTQFNMNVTGQAVGMAGVRVGAGGLTINDQTAFYIIGGSLNNPGVLAFNGGTQTYQDAVLSTDTFLAADSLGARAPLGATYTGGGAILFRGNVSGVGAAPSLTIRTGAGATVFQHDVLVNTFNVTGANVTFDGRVTGLNLLSIAPNANVPGSTTTSSIDLNGGTADSGYTVRTSAGQTYGSLVRLGKDSLLADTGGSPIVFNSTLDGNAGLFNLTIDTAGPVVFGQAVGGVTPLQSLTVNQASGIFINGGSVTTEASAPGVPGGQFYYGPVILGPGLTTLTDLTPASGRQIVFGATLDSNPLTTAGALAVNAYDITFGGAVGAQTMLQSLTAGGADHTFLNGGSVVTDTFQTYGSDNGTVVGNPTGNPTVLTAGTYLTFNTVLTGAAAPADSSLTLTAPGNILFAAAVGMAANGTAAPLTSLVVTEGTLHINGNLVATTNGQLYNGAVLLGATTLLESAANGDIVFRTVLDGGYGLMVNTGGTTAFDGKVGGQTPLKGLTTDDEGQANETTQFNMDATAAGANPAGVNVAGQVEINDAVIFNVAGTPAHPSVQTLGGAQIYNGKATMTADTLLSATGNGNLVFAMTLDGAFNLTLNTGGLTIFNGLVGSGTALASLTTDAGGTTQINGGGVTTTIPNGVARGTQTYNDAVLLGAGATLASRPPGSAAVSGDIVFNSTVDGPYVLTLNTGGRTIFNGLVGSAAPLAGLTSNTRATPGAETQFNMTVGAATAGVLVNGTVTINDPVTFNVAGSSLTQPAVLTVGNGAQNYNGPVTLALNTTLTSAAALPATAGAFTGGGAISFTSPLGITSMAAGLRDLNVRAGVGATAFASTVSVGSLDLGGANVTFGGPITRLGTLSVEPNAGVAGGTIVLNGGFVTTTGAQAYDAAVILGASTALAAGGDIVFKFTLDGGHDLSVSSTGDEVFDGVVGGTTKLTSLTTDATGTPAGSAIFNMNVSGAPTGIAGVNVTGPMTINDMVRFNVAGSTLTTDAHPSVSTGGPQLYNGAATLLADTALANTGGNPITFKLTLDGGYGLSVFSAGDEIFGGIVGGKTALTSLTTDAIGTPGGSAFFSMDVAGASAGTGGVNVAGPVIIDDTTIFQVAGSSAAHPSVLTLNGPQTYNGAVSLGALTLLSATANGNVTFASTVNGTFDLTVNTGGLTTFNGFVGGGAPLASLTTDAGGTTQIKGGGITTVSNATATGAQTYNDAVTLLADAMLTSQPTASGGAITFNSTVNGLFNLTVTTSGDTIFNQPVGGQGTSTALLSLLTNGSGVTQLNGNTVNTTGTQTYDEAVSLGADATLTSRDATGAGSAIKFMSTVDGTYALTVNTTGDTIFGGLVGTGSPLTSLTTDAGGTTFINGGRTKLGTTAKPATIATSGFQTYGDAVQLGKETLLTSDGSDITFKSTVDNNRTNASNVGLTVRTSGNTIFDGSVGSHSLLLSLTTDAPGTTEFNIGAQNILTVNTKSAQTYGDDVLLGVNTMLTSKNPGGGNITFGKTINGSFNLMVNTTGDTIFGGIVGGKTALTSLTTDADGTTFINGGGAKPGTIVTSGFQTYGDAVQLGKETFLVSGSDITFKSTVDGLFNLAVTTGGNTIFEGSVGSHSPLASLTTDTSGITGFNATTGGGLSITTTGVQTYGGQVRLGADATLISPTGAITFAKTVNGIHALTVNTGGATTFYGAVGSDADPLLSLTTDAPGTTAVNGGGVTTTSSQTYNDALTFGAVGTTLFYSKLGGTIDFAGTVDAAQRGQNTLQIDTPQGASFLLGNVGTITPLAGLFDGPNTDNTAIKDTTQLPGLLTIGADRVLTSGEQRYEGLVTTTASLARLTASGDTGSDLRFDAAVNATHALTLTGVRIAAQGNIIADGNLDLESTAPSQLLELGGTAYGSANGQVSFNAPTPDPARQGGYVQRPDFATTILLTNKTVTIHGMGFAMGYLQKILALGTLDINVGSGTATVGDIAARNSLAITASQIDLLARPPGDPSQDIRTGVSDNGLNFVADNSIDFGRARVTFIGSTNPTASFITRGANITIQRVQGISLFKDPNVDSQFENALMPIANYDLDALNNAGLKGTILYQPVGGGSQALDTAAALSGALPDQKPIDVAADITISPSQMEELKKLGIHPRVAQRSERASINSKRALFAQLVDGEDKDNYGLLQPIKGGVSRLEPSDYVVVVDRMGEREVQSILKSFEDLYGKNKEKVPEIGGAFSTAFSDYTVQKQTSDPAAFGPFLQSQPGKYPAIDKATRGFDDLFGHIEHLGLTDKEVEKSEQHIVSDLGVSGVTDAEMVTVIKALRKKLPPEQRAASTKAPPSAPVANPAPGATAPAPGATAPTPAPVPEKKTKQPTTVQRDKASPRKTARHQREVKADRRPELAGL